VENDKDMRDIAEEVVDGATPETLEPNDEAAAEAAEAEEALKRLQAVADHIRRESRAARITSPAVFAEEPFSYDEEQLGGVWEAIASDPDLADIVRTPDEKSGAGFLHSTKYLVVPYARLLLRTQANDPVFLIAQTVRDNAETYPRPTPVTFFELDPFNLPLEEVFAHVTVMGSLEEYADIKSVTVSNGMVCLYSDRYLTEPRAMAIAQWAEVDSHLNSNQ
jgi:hypothetical protein